MGLLALSTCYVLGNRCFLPLSRRIHDGAGCFKNKTSYIWEKNRLMIQFLLTRIEILGDTTRVKPEALGPKTGPPLHVVWSASVQICLKT